jgi:DNA-binding Lrp family transcriptional regulator
MDELDSRLLEQLGRNARASNTELASLLGVSEGTVRKRIQKLVDEEVIRKFTVETTTKEGFYAVVLLRTHPEHYTGDIVMKLRGSEGVRKIFETTGQWDVVLEVATNSPAKFNEIIERIRTTDGVRNSESLVVLKIS